MINQLKSRLFTSRRRLEKCRFIVHREEILEFWEDMSLLEKEKLLTIRDNYVLEYIRPHINSYLTNRKFREQYPAYFIKEKNECLLTVYDCIVFRQQARDRQKEMRQILTAFLLIDKHFDSEVPVKVHEVISQQIISTSMLKVKASYIIRLVSFFQKFVKDYFEGEKVVIPDELYFHFLSCWATLRPLTDINEYINEVFICVLHLLENQIIRAFVSSLNPAELERRKTMEPVKILPRPKNKTCFTTTNQSSIGRVDWASLNLSVFRLKYRIEEEKERYLCYKQPEDWDSESDPQQQSNLNEQDRSICLAFRGYRWWMANYSGIQQYYRKL